MGSGTGEEGRIGEVGLQSNPIGDVGEGPVDFGMVKTIAVFAP